MFTPLMVTVMVGQEGVAGGGLNPTDPGTLPEGRLLHPLKGVVWLRERPPSL